MSEFDSRARDWDKELRHYERSKAIADELLETVTLKDGMRALEFGAGTGMLSFILKEKFAGITMMDSSTEMVKVAQEKIALEKARHLNAICLDLEKEDYAGEFDIIYSQMALHHVLDIGRIFRKFHSILRNYGYLAIADLYSEDGSFHGAGFKGHNGFDTGELAGLLAGCGFKAISCRQCHVLKKSIASGELREFPIFMMVALKNNAMAPIYERA